MVFLLILPLGGCAGSANTETTIQQHIEDAGKSVCGHASVDRGMRDGEVTFLVKCKAARLGGAARIAVQAHARSGTQQAIAVDAVSEHPTVSGSQSGYGTCRLKQSMVGCRVEGKDSFTIKGWLRFGESRICNFDVAIAVVKNNQCAGQFCTDPLKLKSLVDGRPSEC